MRIGIVTGEYPPMQGGVGAYSRIIADKLQAMGHDVHIFSREGTRSADLNLSLMTHKGRWGHGAMRKIHKWAEATALDVISLQFQTAAFGMSASVHFLPGFVAPVPVVTTFHDLRHPYLFPKAGRLRPWIVTRLATKSAGVIVTNQTDYEQVKYLPYSTLIPIGSNILTDLPPNYDRAAWRKQAGAQDRHYLIAHFGFVNHSKGVDTLLRSLAILRADGVPAKLVMIGGRTGSSDKSNVAYAKEIDRQVLLLGLDEHVLWTGFVASDEVTAYLNAADVVALPFRDGASFRRGSLMAAIQHACPIVTTRPQTKIPVFTDTMQFVPPDDSPLLAEALQKLYDKPAEREKLRRNVRGLHSVFDWDTIAEKCADFYQRVVSVAL